jgi:hypothetical protein
LPAANRVYLQGIGQVKVDLHRQVAGRVKTIQTKRQGRRWVLVLSCDDVPATPLPATGRQAGIDVGIVSFATTSDGEHLDNPRWGRAAADRLATAQRRLASAKRGSNNRERRRQTVAARHRKIANQRKDFHHKQTRALVAKYDPVVVGDLAIANMMRRAKPIADVETRGSFCPTVPGPSPGLTGVSVTLAGVVSCRFCAPKRKMLGVSGLRSTPGTPRTAAKNAGTQTPKTASPKRSSPASDAVIAHRQTNMPQATSYGPDWPFTPKQREKKPMASSRRRSHT